MLDEKKVINGCKLNVEEHQNTIYQKFYPLAYKYCMRYTTSMEEGHDLIQEVFIKLFDNINKFNGEKFNEFGPWFKKMVINYCIDVHRKNKMSFVDDDSSFDIIESDEYIEPKYCTEEILKAIDKLSPRYKTIFNLHIMDGYTHEEISNMLGITPDSSKSILYKAKNKVRKYLGDS